jgi:hypothetical protein
MIGSDNHETQSVNGDDHETQDAKDDDHETRAKDDDHKTRDAKDDNELKNKLEFGQFVVPILMGYMFPVFTASLFSFQSLSVIFGAMRLPTRRVNWKVIPSMMIRIIPFCVWAGYCLYEGKTGYIEWHLQGFAGCVTGIIASDHF